MYNPRLDRLERIAAETKPLPSTTGYADGYVLAVVDEEYALVPLGELLPTPLVESGTYDSSTGEVTTSLSGSDISGAFNGGIPIITDAETFGWCNVLYPSYTEGGRYEFSTSTTYADDETSFIMVTTISYEIGEDDVSCNLKASTVEVS